MYIYRCSSSSMTEVPKPKTKGRGSQSLAKNQKPILQSLNQTAALDKKKIKKKIQNSLPYKSKNQKAKHMKYHAITLAKNQKSNTSKEPAHINEPPQTKIQRSL